MNNELVERVARAIYEYHNPRPQTSKTAYHLYNAAAAAVLAELAGELLGGTCVWWEDGEMWESSCGVAYNFLSDGPVENEHEFCHKCGKRIAIDEARHD